MNNNSQKDCAFGELESVKVLYLVFCQLRREQSGMVPYHTLHRDDSTGHLPGYVYTVHYIHTMRYCTAA